MLDPRDAGVQRIGDILGASGMDYERQVLGAGLLGDGLEHSEIELRKCLAGPAPFEDGLDAVDARLSERAHLLPGLLRRPGRSHYLRAGTLFEEVWHEVDVFGSVSPFGGEHRAANEKLGAELPAATEERARLERNVEEIAYAFDGRDAAVEIGCERPPY